MGSGYLHESELAVSVLEAELNQHESGWQRAKWHLREAREREMKVSTSNHHATVAIPRIR